MRTRLLIERQVKKLADSITPAVFIDMLLHPFSSDCDCEFCKLHRNYTFYKLQAYRTKKPLFDSLALLEKAKRDALNADPIHIKQAKKSIGSRYYRI